VSYVTNQWVKMNPFEAANRLTELERENSALRNELDEQARLNGKGSERESALRAKVETLERKNALQGLDLATMADVVLGEDADDRSDETLVREVSRMARERAQLKQIAVTAKALVDYEIEGAAVAWPDWDNKFDALKSAIYAARKEKP
jgi:hypothetical protein